MQQSMTNEEKKKFLAETQCIAKISTLDQDGTIHTIPVWYIHDRKNYIITSDVASHHIKNIRRNGDLSLLIDTVQFPTKGVRIKGNATLVEDKETVHDFDLKVTNRYITEEDKAAKYVEQREKASKRVAVIISPVKESSWDFSKDPNEKETFKDSPIFSLN